MWNLKTVIMSRYGWSKMSNNAISSHLLKFQQGHYSFGKLLRKIKAESVKAQSLSLSPRFMGCFHIYLRPESFRFGFHLFLPLFLLRPALIAIKKKSKNNLSSERLPEPFLKHLVRLLKSKEGSFFVDIESADGVKIYIKNGKI